MHRKRICLLVKKITIIKKEKLIGGDTWVLPRVDGYLGPVLLYSLDPAVKQREAVIPS